MCNRYRTARVTRIRDVFGFTHIEPGPPLEKRCRTSGIGPLQSGPFIRGNELAIEQWGLTPERSDSLWPMRTNNARWNPSKLQPEARNSWAPMGPCQRCLLPVEDFDEP